MPTVRVQVSWKQIKRMLKKGGFKVEDSHKDKIIKDDQFMTNLREDFYFCWDWMTFEAPDPMDDDGPPTDMTPVSDAIAGRYGDDMKRLGIK